MDSLGDYGWLGIIGEAERLEGTVIADCVNLACRLEGLCKEFGVRIVTTEECLSATKDPTGYTSRFLGAVAVIRRVVRSAK